MKSPGFGNSASCYGYFATSPTPPPAEKTVVAQPEALPKWSIFVSSGIGGCLGWAVVHPANTIAVRMNLASMQGKQFSLKAMIKDYGILSVYDGLTAGVLRQVFYATSRFGLFETFRDTLHEIRGKTDFASR
jgi:solute carrier family 25 oxoglutarate transporter 11